MSAKSTSVQRASRVHFNQRDKLVAYLMDVMPVIAGGSTFGMQLEQMARMAFGCRMCVMCGGDPLTDTPGCGFVIAGEKGKTEKQRMKSRGRRKISDITRAFLEEIGENPDSLPPLRDIPCPTCGGFGFIPRRSRAHSRRPIDVHPSKAAIARGCAGSKTPTIGNGGGYYLAESAVPLCGSVGAYLAELRKQDERDGAQHALVTEVYIEHSTEVPLWLLTPPGQTLLKRTQYTHEGNHWFRTRLERALGFLDNERAAQRENPDFQRGRLIESASRQARHLLENAADAWNEIAPPDEEAEAERDFRKAVGLDTRRPSDIPPQRGAA